MTDTTVRAVRPDGHGAWIVDCGADAPEIVAQYVVGAVPPDKLVLDLLGDAAVPARLRNRMRRVEVVAGNLSQFTIAAELGGPPPLDHLSDDAMHRSMLWLLDRPEDALASHAAAQVGALAARPGVLATFPSLTDASLSSDGRTTMWVNGFLAHRREGGRAWTSEDADEATATVWATLDGCLPQVRSAVTRQVFTSPTMLTERTGADNPGAHVAPTLDQLMGGRPAAGYAGHRTGIDGVYLTGAGTNPGPSISGLPGRACARALLTDLAAPGLTARGRRSIEALGVEAGRARALFDATWGNRNH